MLNRACVLDKRQLKYYEHVTCLHTQPNQLLLKKFYYLVMLTFLN